MTFRKNHQYLRHDLVKTQNVLKYIFCLEICINTAPYPEKRCCIMAHVWYEGYTLMYMPFNNCVTICRNMMSLTHRM